MNFTIDANASVTSWTNASGENILFPAQTLNGTDRGFSHICYPWGDPDTDFVGYPKHGHIRTGWGDFYKNTSVDKRKKTTWTKFINPCNEAGLEGLVVNEESCIKGVSTLAHTMDFYSCTTQGETHPVSFGVHWYFATGGENFKIFDEDGDLVADTGSVNTYSNDAFIYPYKPNLILETSIGRTSIDGYPGGELVIWSDNPRSYICIEPVYGRDIKDREYLEPGDSILLKCRLTHTPY